ncbi:hypothetical protein BT63DRAFT_74214 [Microthyrium microscopicum]|uniref:Uncharacterized protein n=1 Tax=Microthyrium microscopicum TaxID=703497 RepID=A0A6A6U3M2_9PEZI|nr:hypothetical protein BT63DRAFT_74214 [Microthyrium microscopicum]
MEYLTIQEPRSSYFRGMDHHQADGYGGRSRDDFPRQPRHSDHDRGASSDSYHRIDPVLSTSSSKAPRWAESNGSSFYYPHPTESSIAPVSGSNPARAAPSSSIASLLRPVDQSGQEPGRPSTPEWNHPVQPVPVRPTGQTVQELQAKEEQQPLKLPSFNSVSNFGPSDSILGVVCVS